MKLRALSTALFAGFCAFSIAGCAKAVPDYMYFIRHNTKPAKAPWIALKDYPRPPAPDTGWGIHDHTDGDWYPKDPDAFFHELKHKYGFSWFKILALGGNKVDECRAAHRQGVEPIVRLFKSSPLPDYPKPGKEENELRKLIIDYVGAGAHYFEIANEPTLGGEWSGEWNNQKHTYAEQISAMCKQWLRAKKIIQECGGIPVFYANAGGGGQWDYDCFKTFAKMGKIEDAFAGAAIGIHATALNHPLDYPFNPEKNMPHATKEEAFNSLLKDNSCFNILQFVMLLEDKYLPSQIPILSTEGGVAVGESQDGNYPKTTVEIATERNMEIFNRMNPQNPDYWGDAFFSMDVWAYGGSRSFMFDGWFNSPRFKGGNHPVLAIMEKTPKFDRGSIFRN